MWWEWCSFHHSSRFIYHPVVNCVLHIAITVSVHFHQYLNFQVHVTITGKWLLLFFDTLLNSFFEVGVLHGRRHPLLVVDLLVHIRLGAVAPLSHQDVQLHCAGNQHSFQLCPGEQSEKLSQVQNHLIHKPISVARWQCGTVGTNSICATNLSPALLIG